MPIDNQPIPGMKPGNYGTQPGVVTPPVPLKNPKKEKMATYITLRQGPQPEKLRALSVVDPGTAGRLSNSQ